AAEPTPAGGGAPARRPRKEARQRQGPTKPSAPCPACLALQYRPPPAPGGLPRLCRPPGRQSPLAVLLRYQRGGSCGRAQQECPPTLLRVVERGGGAALGPKAPGPGSPGSGATGA